MARLGSGQLGALLAGLATWGAVAIPVVLSGHPAGVTWWLAWISFGAAYLVQDRGGPSRDHVARAALAVQILTAAVTNWIVPAAMPGVAIGGALFVITAARMVPALPVPVAIGLVAVQTIVLLGSYAEAGWSRSIGLISALAFLGFQLFALFTGILAERERAAKERLTATLDELRVTQALLGERERREEREDLLRDLHDSAGHHLTALILHLQAAKAGDEERRSDAVRTAEVIARALLGDLRQFVADRRTDLAGDLRRLVEAADRAYRRGAVTADIDPELTVRDARVAEAAYRAGQEGLTNAIRHADATTVTVRCERENGTLRLQVTDDGAGDRPEGHASGSGLEGIRTRVERRGGHMRIGRSAAGGFELEIEIPLDGDGS